METHHFEAEYPQNSYSKVIEKLLGYIKEGTSVQLVGIPGAGRANLLAMLTYNSKVREKHLAAEQKNYHFVLLTLAEVRSKSLEDVTKYMFLELIDSLLERNMQEAYERANAIFKDALSYHDELVLFQELKKTIDFLALEKNLTIILLFDQFEEYIPMLSPEFFTNLRILRDRAKYQFSVVFSLSRPLEDVVDATLFADFYEFIAGHIVYLPLLDKAILDFRIAHLEKLTGKTVDRKHLDEILELTGGHAKLTRVCLESCLNESYDENNFTEFLISQKAVLGVLYEIWYALTPAEQKHLKLMQTATPPEDSHEYLIKSHLLENNQLQIPLLIPFMQTIQVQNDTHDKLIYDADVNQIKKGSQNISDLLTSAEFRLLRFLLQHQDEIVERDQIIEAVWHDSKSTAGVTDQAVDQLVFRLRKKIEENVNNPQHLLTIKGRGLKFTP